MISFQFLCFICRSAADLPSGRWCPGDSGPLRNAADVWVPPAVSAFPGENYQAPRSWTQQAYHNLIYYNQPGQGGHFAAWEQPQIFAAEVRAGLRPLRK